MLDFYWVNDVDDADPDQPLDRLVGSLTLEEHQSLSPLLDLASQSGLTLWYFEDTRLKSQEVRMLANLVREISGSTKAIGDRNAYDTISAILGKAIERQAGLIAVCD